MTSDTMASEGNKLVDKLIEGLSQEDKHLLTLELVREYDLGSVECTLHMCKVCHAKCASHRGDSKIKFKYCNEDSCGDPLCSCSDVVCEKCDTKDE